MVRDSRKEKIIEEVEKGREIKDIARDLGLDVSYIYRVIKTNDIKRSDIKQHNKLKQVISPVHKLLGKCVKKARLYKLEDEAKKTLSDAIDISTQRITFLERGTYDPTLTDLMKIFKALDIKFSSIDNIIKEVEETKEIESYLINMIK